MLVAQGTQRSPSGAVASLTAAAHGDPHLIQAARTTVFHDGFAAGATFAVVALLVSVTAT